MAETTVLTVASRAVLDACERLGLDADQLLTDAGATRAEVADPDHRLRASQADAIWQAAWARAADPALALHAAEALPFGAYRVLDFLAAHSPTVGAALTRIVAYFPLVDPRGGFEIDGDDPVALAMRARDPHAELPPPAQEYTLAALVTRVRHVAGSAWRPSRVELAFGAPVDDTEHRRLFGCEVRFDAPDARLVCARALWDAPVVGADPGLLSVLDDHAARLLAELPAGEDLPSQVRAAIAAELGGGVASAARVARRLAMSERTLQRRLRGAGKTFAQLLDETRFAVAKAHLADPSTALAEIAWLLGFSDQSAFTKAFRRWSGIPPGEWRAARR